VKLFVQLLLLVGGALMLAYCAFVLGEAWIFQRRANQTLECGLPGKPTVTPDGLIGRLDIPRIGLSAVVAEGTDDVTLRRSVGHVSYTTLPGKPGNIGLAGHRDTFFRPLKNIRQDDIVILVTPRGDYRYRVTSTRVVKPSEVSVLLPTKTEVLTLVTCYPFNFIGAAPKRFIVQAERII